MVSEKEMRTFIRRALEGDKEALGDCAGIGSGYGF